MRFTTLKALTKVACCGIPRSMVASRSVSVAVTRWYTSVPQPYQHITIKCNNEQNGVSVLEMKKKPVNSLSLEFLTELNICLEKITNDKSIRGLIITSALPVFSAGLDIMELYEPKDDRLRTYWHNVQELTLNLHSSPKIVMTAVEGPCIAGGCIFVWGSDYRIMSEGKHTIGLNETRLGIAAPFWLADLAINNMGLRNAEKMLQLGETYPAKEAVRLGAVDETCPQGKSLEIAQQRMETWLSVPDSGRQVTKHMVRQKFIDNLLKKREHDKDVFCSLIKMVGTQKQLGKYLESLKNKAK